MRDLSPLKHLIKKGIPVKWGSYLDENGIAVKNCPLTNPPREIVELGGQDHFKPLHQFFYSKNTLYVLVSRNGDATVNDFDYWLDTAQLFGQSSPVLLVHNLFGDVRSRFNRQKYARFDETIKECLDVNLADHCGVPPAHRRGAAARLA